MSEQEPSMNIRVNGEEFESTPNNTTLFRHIGRLAMFDHIFLEISQEPPRGAYIFTHIPAFEEMATYMVDNDYPRLLGKREVADVDLEAYERQALADVRSADTFPDDWV